MPRNDGTHGARPLGRLMSLILGLVLLVAAAAAVWLLISFPLWWSDAPRIGLPIEVAVGGHEQLLTVTSDLGEVELGTLRGDLEIEFENAWAQWFYILGGLVQILVVGLILHRLRRVVGAFARKEGLSGSTARDLRWAGGLMVIESLVAPLVSMWIASQVLGQVTTVEAPLMIDYVSDFGRHGFISGWILIILSAALSQGADLRDEQSLTV